MKKIFALILGLAVLCFATVSLLSCKLKLTVKRSSASDISESEGIDSGESDFTDEFTVSFDSAGGTAVLAQTVASGECAKVPTEPTKGIDVLPSGATIEYVFAGWYNGDEEYDFSSAVESDLELTAKWDEVRLSPPLSGRD